jgi:hypothetical protein
VFSALLGLSQAAFAACPQDGAKPFKAGPVHPVNGFASYVQDSEGLALELCLSGDGNGICFFDPAIPNNQFSEAIGFGAEGFWWLAEGSVATTQVDALVVMAAEAAFAAEVPGPGEQFPFTRLRIRIDTTNPGIYTLTHPYGQQTWTLETAGVKAVNETNDLQFAPNAMNQGRVGPWLTSVGAPFADPLGGPGSFIGNGTPLPAVGSPCGTDFVRLTATQLNGAPLNIDPTDLDGDGRTDSVSSNLFTIFGKHYEGTVQTPLTAAATYSRAADGSVRVNVFAKAPTTATVTALVGATPTSLGGDGDRYFASLTLPAGSAIPAVEVTADNNPPLVNNLDTTQAPAVSDVVAISKAEATCGGAPRTCTLVIEASSSDPSASAALTGTGTVSGLTVVPATVTVTSTGGGSDTEPVKVINQ